MDHVVFICALAKEVPHRFYRVSKIDNPPTVWCGAEGFSPSHHLVIDCVDLIVHRPSGGVGNVLRNHASALVKVAINSRLAIVRFDASDVPLDVFIALKWLPWVIDEISDILYLGSSPEVFPSVWCQVISPSSSSIGASAGSAPWISHSGAREWGDTTRQERLSSSESISPGIMLIAGAGTLPSGTAVYVGLCRCGEYSHRHGGWLRRWLASGGSCPWSLIRRRHLRCPRLTNILPQSGYGHSRASRALLRGLRADGMARGLTNG